MFELYYGYNNYNYRFALIYYIIADVKLFTVRLTYIGKYQRLLNFRFCLSKTCKNIKVFLVDERC